MIEVDFVAFSDSGPLHPENRVAWLQVVEAGEVVCDHCGMPVPCVDAVLAHMRTDEHHEVCQATGHCYYARRPVEELPKL